MLEIHDLVEKISSIKPKSKSTLIAIDGIGGSGKSTLAHLLKKKDTETNSAAFG